MTVLRAEQKKAVIMNIVIRKAIQKAERKHPEKLRVLTPSITSFKNRGITKALFWYNTPDDSTHIVEISDIIKKYPASYKELQLK